MATVRTTTTFLGTVLFAAGIMVACAGEGVDNTNNNSGSGGNKSSNGGSSNSASGGNSGSGSGGSSSSSGTGGSSTSTGSGGSASTGAGGGSSTGGITTVGGYHTSGTLKGYFWTSSDSKAPGTGTSMITPATFELTPKICASGTAAKVPSDTAYATHWGALVGWNVSQADMPPNMPAKAAVTGTITVGIAGTTVPTGLRLKVAVGADDYCAPLMAGTNTIKASDLKKSCWIMGGAAYAGEPVEAIAVQVTTNTTSTTPFDFCVTEMTVK